MARAVKERMVAELVERYRSIENCVVCGYEGTSAQEFDGLRGALATRGVDLHVVKNSLFGRALEQMGRGQMADLLDGPCVIATGGEDSVELVKAVVNVSKDAETLAVRGAVVEGRLLDVSGTQAVGRIPSQEVLYGQIVGLVASPMRALACTLAALPRSLYYAFAEYREKLEKESQP